jgi:uncharacterized phage protein (TIGR02218 family)
MTFNAFETSLEDGQPIELYEFTIGVKTYRYTSYLEDIIYQTKTYTQVQISRGEIEDSGEVPKNSLTIECQRDLEVADLFRIAPPTDVVILNIRRLHLGDGINPESKLMWTGRVLTSEWSTGGLARLTCESLYTALKRRGLRRLYQRQCPHILYGAACGVPATSWKHTISVNNITGVSLIDLAIQALGDNYFAGGYIEWEREPGVIERRAIRTHVGDTVTLSYPVEGLVNGATIDFFAGCDHTTNTCGSKFNNRLNYGGFPFIPRINPFGGANVF